MSPRHKFSVEMPFGTVSWTMTAADSAKFDRETPDRKRRLAKVYEAMIRLDAAESYKKRTAEAKEARQYPRRHGNNSPALH